MLGTKKRRVHRRRYRESSFDRYRIERYMGPMYEGVKTVRELRERFRQFAESQWIWDAMEGIKKAADTEQVALESFEAAVKRAFPGKKRKA